MSAAPMKPALGPSWAPHDHRLGAVSPAGEGAGERLPDRVEQQVAGLGDAAADDDAARVEGGGHAGEPGAEPARRRR